MSLVPRNNDVLDQLERDAAGLLAVMARGALQSGQMPPRDIMSWFAHYTVEALIATEDMARQVTTSTPREEMEAIAKQLETTVIVLADLFRHLAHHKLLVLHDQLMGKLRARALRLPTDYDTSYDGMLPRV